MISVLAIWLVLGGYGVWSMRLPGIRGLPPLARLGVGAAAAVGLVYLVAGAVYLLRLSPATVTVSLLLPAALLVVYGPQLWRGAPGRLRWAVLGSVVFSLWCGVLAALMPIPGGGNWMQDWLEHAGRARFFLEHWRLDHPEMHFVVPARPPLMNLLEAYFLAVLRRPVAYLDYQLVATCLNSLAGLPLIIAAAHGRSRAARWLMLAVVFTTPFLLWNSIYPWTRGLSNALIIGGLLLYLRASRRPGRGAAVVAFAVLALATLAHYSAGPYIVVTAAHWLWSIRRAPGPRLRQTVWIATVSAVILATWFGPAIAAFGLRGTLGSNSSVSEVADRDAMGALAVKGRNLVVSLVPHPLLGMVPDDFREPAGEPLLRADLHSYMLTQTNGVGMVGPLLVVAFVLALARGLRDRRRQGRLLTIAGLAAAAAVLGILVVGEPHDTGCAHLCLQPLLILLMLWAAAASADQRLPCLLIAVNQLVLLAALGLHLATLIMVRDLYVAGRVTPELVAESWTLQHLGPAYLAIRDGGMLVMADRPALYLVPSMAVVALAGLWLALRRRGGEGRA